MCPWDLDIYLLRQALFIYWRAEHITLTFKVIIVKRLINSYNLVFLIGCIIICYFHFPLTIMMDFYSVKHD